MEPTPTRTSSPRQAGLRLLAGMVAFMWLVEVIDTIDSHRLDADGIRPRSAGGLVGVLTAPVLHVSFAHLIANTVPFVFMGIVVALSGAGRLAAVTAIVVLAGGLGTWLIAPAHTVTVGASGVVFGYATYLVARGFFDHSALELAAGAVVGVVWGGALLASLVPHCGISWQGHACGAAAGVLAARVLRRAPPFRLRRRFALIRAGRARWGLLGAVLLGLAIRLVGLGERLSHDEGYTWLAQEGPYVLGRPPR